MKNHIALMLTAILIAVTLSACGAQTPEPTATAVPSNTPLPTATFTPAPTDTPEPTHTPTPTIVPKLELGEMQEVPAGGFSFQSIKGYEIDIDGPNISVAHPTGTTLITMMGSSAYDGSKTPEETLDEFLIGLQEYGFGEFEKGEIHPVTVNGVEGTALDLTGNTSTSLFEGQAVLVIKPEDQYVLGLALTRTGEDKNKWKNEGSVVFSTLLETIQFIEVQELGGSACPVSSDKTYGYSKDNAIKVGGDWFDGPARERAYLDSLSGPNGEPISYVRTGSLEHGDTILDAYQVSYSGTAPVILYIDEYRYEALMAPSGFICQVPIPLSEP